MRGRPHRVDDGLVAAAAIRLDHAPVVLVTGGIFLLNDWIRQPLPDYLTWSMTNSDENPAIARQQGLRLFAVHNKYTTEDWQWLLHETDFAILRCGQLRPTHRMFVAIPTGSCHSS